MPTVLTVDQVAKKAEISTKQVNKLVLDNKLETF